MRSGLNAIMGPTGSGKTTYVRPGSGSLARGLACICLRAAECVCVCVHRLLDVLADRKGRRGWSGDILVDGKRRPKNFKCLCGYVVQVISELNLQLKLKHLLFLIY